VADSSAVIAKDLETRPLQARCHLGLATMHLREDDPAKACVHLTIASDTFRALGMRHWLEKTSAELANLLP